MKALLLLFIALIVMGGQHMQDHDNDAENDEHPVNVFVSYYY